jgi:hypothetical protein
MNLSQSQSGERPTRGSRGLKGAVLASFQGSAREAARQFLSHSQTDWQAILVWLDISGMALYLLDRVRELEIEDSVPVPIRERLQLSLEHNRERTVTLLRQARSVVDGFQLAGISFALMKGITLTPDSVPEPALRWQTDLDFLVAESDALAATGILRNLGYKLHATSGSTLEFRSGSMGKPDLANLYRASTQRSLELHCLRRQEGLPDRLTRASARLFEGASIPALSAADTMVQQALHLMKHLCGEHTRTSWVLEFWRHVLLRQHDRAFWSEVRVIAAAEPQADIALAMSLWLAADMFGAIPNGAAEHWAADRIPGGVLLWLRRYARELLLSDSYASKLYLLLRRQLPNRPDLKDTARLIIPLCLPARITQPKPGETLADRLTRYGIEASYGWRRLRFHLFEGLRCGIEALYWEWRIPKVQQR